MAVQRQRFARLLGRRRHVKSAITDLYDQEKAIQQEADERYCDEYMKTHKRRRKPVEVVTARLWAEKHRPELYAEYQRRFDDLLTQYKHLTTRAEELTTETRLVGQTLDIVCNGNTAWRQLTWIYGGAYSTQTQPEYYLRMACEQEADRARMYDVPVRISDAPGGKSIDVQLSRVDLEILKTKDGPSLREQVRLCWKRGVNPRVFNPWLPPGYEDRVGLDYFGGETRADHGEK